MAKKAKLGGYMGIDAQTPKSKKKAEFKLEFIECPTCAAKSGTPALCPSCLHNREVISRLQKLMVEWANTKG